LKAVVNLRLLVINISELTIRIYLNRLCSFLGPAY